MPDEAERKALNEQRFREANEDLERRARKIDAESPLPTPLVPFLCECPDRLCREVVLLTLDEYEEVRSVPERGLATAGHEDLSVERVVGQNHRYVTTEKFGRAGATHKRTDPRT